MARHREPKKSPSSSGVKTDVGLVVRKKKWTNFTARLFSTLILLALFALVIAAGHLYCSLLVLALITCSYFEVMGIGRNPNSPTDLHAICWYGLGILTALKSHIVRCIGSVADEEYMNFGVNKSVAKIFVSYIPELDKFLNLVLYIGVVATIASFIFSLRVKTLKNQLRSFVKMILVTAIIVMQGASQIKTMNFGLVWFLVSTTSVICNDIAAYLCGCRWGRTHFLDISPNKTLEGFIGASIASVIWAISLGELLCRIPILICSNMPLDFAPLWTKSAENYMIPARFLWKTLSIYGYTFSYRAVWLDFLVFGLFASFAAPFGGFLGSAFKRYLAVKDFGALIPGHGGITDRFDCQSLMGMFAYLYIRWVMNDRDPMQLLRHVRSLPIQNQIDLIKSVLAYSNISITSLE